MPQGTTVFSPQALHPLCSGTTNHLLRRNMRRLPTTPSFRSICRLIANVIPMHNGKNGVNGPAQKSRQADAITDPVFHPNRACSRYPPQTGKYITAITVSKRAAVLTSRHSVQIHRSNSRAFSNPLRTTLSILSCPVPFPSFTGCNFPSPFHPSAALILCGRIGTHSIPKKVVTCYRHREKLTVF